MKAQQFSLLRASSFALVSLFLIAIFSSSCNQDKADDASVDLGNSNVLNISYEVPGDLPVDASMEDLAIFAWNEFFALNWESSYSIDQKRTTPNTSWDFATSGAAPDLAVWETYIHRTELRPVSGARTADLSAGLPQYSFINPIDSNGVNINNYWNNLDEDNEIGSCYLFANRSQQVLYMAKCNLVEYDYVKNNFPTDPMLYKAAKKANNPGFIDYLKKRSTDGSACNSDTATNVICLPCGTEGGSEGSIEIKAAFRMLDPEKDDPTRFMTKEVVYYTSDVLGAAPTANTGTMALIGLHIIHKTTNYPDFIFASWEQVDVRNIGMETIGIGIPSLVVGTDTIPDTIIDPVKLTPVRDRNPISIPATLQNVTNEAWDLIKEQNPESAWQYYQLIGVQATPIDYADRSSDENYFMANYVIESDSTLTDFHGSFAIPFDSTIKNTIWKGNAVNMGGCQGCHGQAQTAFGTDFSFLLDSGQGKPVPSPDRLLTLQQAMDTAIAKRAPKMP